ncbi:rhomboid family intramembrane serine protease [Halobellus clavatus]|jgi:membrane associated rhomboid family serine protease|uniref:Membrane associated serine protease, rhomboid family n=1 Tax=Halobellus clavatus TaxID=660517 RepID=A0A1H3ENV8_9EURY|nr:rhomboid family intramembrane serine protease [Halobellus clavatus]SDX79639.1 Membrane associated serine protease, rhomboid family [Halobellus clavatus]
MRRVSVSNLLMPFENGLRPVFADHRSLSAPVTDLLVVIVCAVYAVQAFQTALWGAPSVFVTTNYVYLRAPWLAWPLSPLLHGGLVHVIPNVVTLFAFGRIAEATLPGRRYASMALVASVASIGALAAWSLAFGSGPQAVYGISGVVFAVGGFAIAYFPRHRRATDLELLATLFGACALALVATESIAALVLASPATANVGHTAGLLVGVATGLWTPLRHDDGGRTAR